MMNYPNGGGGWVGAAPTRITVSRFRGWASQGKVLAG